MLSNDYGQCRFHEDVNQTTVKDHNLVQNALLLRGEVKAMKAVDDYVLSYMVTLKNKKIIHVLKADVLLYLKDVGFTEEESQKGIKQVLQSGKIILLKNGKLSLSFGKR